MIYYFVIVGTLGLLRGNYFAAFALCNIGWDDHLPSLNLTMGRRKPTSEMHSELSDAHNVASAVTVYIKNPVTYLEVRMRARGLWWLSIVRITMHRVRSRLSTLSRNHIPSLQQSYGSRVGDGTEARHTGTRLKPS